ncbi:MAG TPA: hypothetical protein VJR92_10550 [Gemmatimonadaceae bacterium]|nr:hypothetical protein [Gemmatimonadaceae bacterium]
MTVSASARKALPGAAELRREAATVRVGVEPGAPITSYIAAGRDWCADAWRDFGPTRAGCVLPTYVSGAGGTAFPEGGLLAADVPSVQVRADGKLGVITAQWPQTGYPLDWVRTVALDKDGSLLAQYRVHNMHDTTLPFVWGIPIPLPWDRSVAIDLPRGARGRVAWSVGRGLAASGSEFTWPSVRDGGRLIDLTQPTQLAQRSALLCFVELADGRFTVRAGKMTLEISGDSDVLTHARLHIVHDADLPGAPARRWWRRHRPMKTITIGPAAGAPDSLSDAVGSWRSAQWLEPGATMVWTVRYRANPRSS